MGGYRISDWPRPRPRHILFFAAVPPPPFIRHVQKIWPLVGTGDRLRDKTLHMTILPVIGDDAVDPGLVRALSGALAGFSFPSFDITFDRIIAFRAKKKRPIVLRTPETDILVDRLARTVGRALTGTFPKFPKPGRVTPHVTLAYGAGFDGERLLPAPLGWRIRDIALFDSVQGEGRHIHLARWRLGSGG